MDDRKNLIIKRESGCSNFQSYVFSQENSKERNNSSSPNNGDFSQHKFSTFKKQAGIMIMNNAKV